MADTIPPTPTPPFGQDDYYYDVSKGFRYNFLNFFYNSLFSRKFIVFVFASVMFYFGKVDLNAWLILAFAYMGANVLEKVVEIFNKR